MNSHLDLLIAGYRAFKKEFFGRNQPLYRKLVTEGQSPRVCVIACADSRVDPAFVMQVQPGEVFTIRNVANLVPPFETQGTYHGVSAAVEFAVVNLGVEEIVVLGHAHCGGIRALIAAGDNKPSADTFITRWMGIAMEALRRVDARTPGLPEAERARACERSAVLVSLDNLMTFPWVRARVEAGTLRLHGWYFNLTEGELQLYDPKTGEFAPA